MGDTPDDIVAAVRAGAVGVGVLTPEEYARKTLSADGGVQAKGMEGPMLKAGARCVMDPGFAGLLDMFPPAADDGEAVERPGKRASGQAAGRISDTVNTKWAGEGTAGEENEAEMNAAEEKLG